MIKAVIFDWGGVLIEEPGKGIREYCASKYGVSYEAFSESLKPFMPLLNTGKISEDVLWPKIGHVLKKPAPKTPSLWGEAFRAVYTPKEEVWELVKTVRQNGYKTGFLSNTELASVEYFKEKNYSKLFDATIFSCIEGFSKPSPEIYKIALKKLKIKPEEGIFIDDRDDYIEGAKVVGLRTILFHSPTQVKQELKDHRVKID